MLTKNTYDFGETVPCYALFVDKVAGAAFTPDALTFKASKQGGNDPTTYTFGTDDELANEELPDDVLTDLLPAGITAPTDETGQFRVYFVPDASGEWFYRFASTGDGQTAREGHFTVREAEAV